MRSLTILLVLIAQCSCNPIFKTFGGANKNIEFKSIGEYNSYISSHVKINPANTFYVKADDYNEFMNFIMLSKMDYYFGTFLNDGTEIIKSETLKKNESCSGNVLQEINFTLLNKDKLKTQENDVFKKFSFINIKNQELLNMSDDKIKIALIYSYKMGILRKKDFIKIQRLTDTSNTHRLVIISLDYIAGLPFQ